MTTYNYQQRILNSAPKPFASTISNHVTNYPTPSNLNYNWSYGSLAGLFFALQIITGIFLAMHYTPHVEWAFASVEHIMTDVTGGYIFRYFHANGASMIFILIYAHMGRGLYFQSYLTRPALWHTGVVIFLLMMATAFIGYVLPWGQMSFWGATVITSLVTAVPFIGEDIAYWVWGGFSINNATLTRFFSLHFLLPFLILGIIVGHLVLLHTNGSSDPMTLPTTEEKITFHPYYTFKDTFIFFAVFALFAALAFYSPNKLGHSDNFLPANPLVTPAHIVPEWYFTPFYAILRACPNKLGGAIGMFASILLLFFVPYYVDARTPEALTVFAPYALPHKVLFWGFSGVFLTLMFLGTRAAAAPYVWASKIFTGLYFAYFLLAIPFLAWFNSAFFVKTTTLPIATPSTQTFQSTALPPTTPNTQTLPTTPVSLQTPRPFSCRALSTYCICSIQKDKNKMLYSNTSKLRITTSAAQIGAKYRPYYPTQRTIRKASLPLKAGFRSPQRSFSTYRSCFRQLHVTQMLNPTNQKDRSLMHLTSDNRFRGHPNRRLHRLARYTSVPCIAPSTQIGAAPTSKRFATDRRLFHTDGGSSRYVDHTINALGFLALVLFVTLIGYLTRQDKIWDVFLTILTLTIAAASATLIYACLASLRESTSRIDWVIIRVWNSMGVGYSSAFYHFPVAAITCGGAAVGTLFSAYFYPALDYLPIESDSPFRVLILDMLLLFSSLLEYVPKITLLSLLEGLPPALICGFLIIFICVITYPASVILSVICPWWWGWAAIIPPVLLVATHNKVISLTKYLSNIEGTERDPDTLLYAILSNEFRAVVFLLLSYYLLYALAIAAFHLTFLRRWFWEEAYWLMIWTYLLVILLLFVLYNAPEVILLLSYEIGVDPSGLAWLLDVLLKLWASEEVEFITKLALFETALISCVVASVHFFTRERD